VHPSCHLHAHALTLLLASASCSPPHHDSVREFGGAGLIDGGGPAADGGDAPLTPWVVEPFPDVPAPADNPITDAKTTLGRFLFYDPVVSADHEVACATCHSEVWGMSDGLTVSVGQGGGLVAGPGRYGPHETRRNSPTLWNVAYRTSAFWDGRAASLEDQVHFPFESADEFDRKLTDALADVRGIPEYVSLFEGAFPDETDPVTENNFARAIASFERTILSENGLYDAFVVDDPAAMSPSMIRGMHLFGEEGCADCHRPPLFSSERFEDRHVPRIPGVPDAGRFEITGNEADRNRFKVPTLRNAHDTSPYFHTGAVIRLADAIEQEVVESAAHDGARLLSGDELLSLTEFIQKGLVDGQHSPTRPHEVPSGLPVPIDGSSIRR
jgi:cytochrome c peroxidase